jgi:hypothetical protein
VALDQLDGQAGLSHASAADYYQLVLSEKLRAGQQGCGTVWGAKRTLEAIVNVCEGAASAMRRSCEGAATASGAPGQLGRREGEAAEELAIKGGGPVRARGQRGRQWRR